MSSENWKKIETLIETEKSSLWIVKNYTDDIYEKIKDISLEEKPPIILMGKKLKQRRDVGFFSDVSGGYKYSGAFMKSMPLTPFLSHVLKSVNKSLQTNFNGILVNSYLNGDEYLSAHSDNEEFLDKKNKMVAGLAYGAIRKFRVRDKKTKKILMDIEHEPGMLVVMQGEFQNEFTHEIPKQKKIQGRRISLTFRYHLK